MDDERTRKVVRSILSPHGLEQLVGTDIAAISIPAAAAINVPLLDPAAGYLLANPGGPLYISQGATFNRATGMWNAEPGVTQATLIVLVSGAVEFFQWSGSAGAQNITWGSPTSYIDAGGNIVAQSVGVPGGPMGQTNETTPGYLKLGAITLLFGVNDITMGSAPIETALFIPFPIAVTQPLVVMATFFSTDRSQGWIATNSWGPTGFTAVIFRSDQQGGNLGSMAVWFTWLAVAIT